MSTYVANSSYTILATLSLARTFGAAWSKDDLSKQVVSTLFENYQKVYLTLKNSVLTDPLYVDMDSLKEEFGAYSGTLAQLIIDYKDRTFETVSALPTDKLGHVNYSDAFRAGYKVDLTIAGRNLPDNFPQDDKTDLIITRPSYTTDVSKLHTHCMVSVNGFFHNTDTDGTNAFVYDGAETMRKSRNNNLGISSFLNVGKLTKTKFTKDSLYTSSNTSHLKDKVLFSIDQDLTGKSFFLVLGGYLIYPDDESFYQTGPNSFALDLMKIPYLERIFESRHFIDLSSLGLEGAGDDEDNVIIDMVYSDDTITKYFLLSQSFFVTVDSQYLLYNHIQIRNAPMPGMFVAYQDPIYPLFVGYGRLAEYWKVEEDGQWSVTVQDSFLRNYVISEQPQRAGVIANDNKLSFRPFDHSRGFLLEITGYSNT